MDSVLEDVRVVFSQESASDVLDEIQSLAEAHEQEILDDIITEWPLKIDHSIYLKMDEMGVLRVFAARCGGELVGYASFVVSPSLRREGLVIATEDALYLHPDHRGGGTAVRLLAYIAKKLATEAHLVIYHSPCVNPKLGAVLSRLGYTKHSECFVRRL